MRIALVQFSIDHPNKQANWDRAEAYMAQAAQQKVDLIVFPEFFLGGPGRKSTLVNPTYQLCILAQRYGMDLVPGTVIEQDDQGQYHNNAYYIDASGKVLLKYTKVHLWQHERKYLEPGAFTFGTVKNRFGIVVGLCACWDLANPAVFREMALNGKAQLVIVPAYWTMTEVDGEYDSVSEHNLVSHLCAARAFENGICVAFCDAAEGASSPYGRLTGASRVAVPFKGVVAQAPGDHEHLLITTLDIPGETSSAESLFQFKADWHAGRVFTGSKL